MAGSEYYDHTSYPTEGSIGSSSALRSELDAIEAGFGKLPALSGNANKIVKVNSSSTGLTIGTLEDQDVGYLNIPQNSKSAAYTCVLTDAGKHILHPSADTTARTFTIPDNATVAFPIGTSLTFINQASAGVVTIEVDGTDVMTTAGTGVTGSRTLSANGIATALKITSTDWLLVGTGLV